jgi:hypothetical protein
MDDLNGEVSLDKGASGITNAFDLNQERFAAWRTLLLALGSCAIVALVFISTKTWIWTGGLLLAGSWVFRSVKSLREANAQLVAQERLTGSALKAPLPTWIKACSMLAVPVIAVLGIQALNQYDPSILASAGNQPYLDSPPSFQPTDAEGNASDFRWYAGAQVVLPDVCSVLTLNWHTEDKSSNEISNYSNKFNSGLLMDSSNRLVFGTNADVSDTEVYFVPDSVSCD